MAHKHKKFELNRTKIEGAISCPRKCGQVYLSLICLYVSIALSASHCIASLIDQQGKPSQMNDVARFQEQLYSGLESIVSRTRTVLLFPAIQFLTYLLVVSFSYLGSWPSMLVLRVP